LRSTATGAGAPSGSRTGIGRGLRTTGTGGRAAPHVARVGFCPAMAAPPACAADFADDDLYHHRPIARPSPVGVRSTHAYLPSPARAESPRNPPPMRRTSPLPRANPLAAGVLPMHRASAGAAGGVESARSFGVVCPARGVHRAVSRYLADSPRRADAFAPRVVGSPDHVSRSRSYTPRTAQPSLPAASATDGQPGAVSAGDGSGARAPPCAGGSASREPRRRCPWRVNRLPRQWPRADRAAASAPAPAAPAPARGDGGGTMAGATSTTSNAERRVAPRAQTYSR